MTDPLTPAQRQMVADNLGLCGWAVNRWCRNLPIDGNGYTQEDAFQDAVFGLARAAQLFDPSKGFTFATYAARWMQKSMQRGRGAYEGVQFRSAQAGYGEYPKDAVLLSTPIRSGSRTRFATVELELADTIPDPADAELEAIVNAELAGVLATRDQVCADDMDRAIFDAMTAPHDSKHSTFVALGAQLGVSREAIRRRWLRIQRHLRSIHQPFAT